MNPLEHGFRLRLALMLVIACCASCSGSDTAGDDADVSAPETSVTDGGGTMTSPQAASVLDSFKAMAASQGMYFGEVPDGFPLDLLPLYPGGEIDKSAVNDEDFTLLQVVPADKDAAYDWYNKFYTGIGWSDDKRITVAGRTMTGFQSKDGRVDMTLMDREEGKTFVSLVLSPR